MAQKRYIIDGYGQLELNNAAFRRDGRVEAQCALDSTDFSSAPAENGMLLAVDKVHGTIRVPDTSETCPIAIHYSAEHMYDERHPGLKNFKLGINDGFYPRMGYLAVGDLFTTNCISYDSAEDSTWASDADFETAMKAVKSTPAYGTQSSDGSILVSGASASEGVKLEVVKATTMPDGQFAVQFRVLSV